MSASPKRCPQCSGRFPADFRVCPRDATPLEDAPEETDPLVGTVLSDSYEIVRAIGEGGMGRVYEAMHRRLRNRRFAIKVLHHELARQPEVVTRFQREAEAASALTHPNVLEVFDVDCTPDGRPYIVSELLEGEELGQHLDRLGRLGLREGIGIVRQICRALAVAHARGVVHRDMKPENVFLVGQGDALRVKVLDFGISKLADGKGTLTKTGVVLGTPAYMPPEQARGSHVDHRADIYAVGAILYRTLTGSKPFLESDVVATLTAVVADEPTRPSTLERSIPPGLELVIQKAMAKNPAERYGSLTELDAALAEHDPEATPGAAPPPDGVRGAAGTARTVLDPTARASGSHSEGTRSAGRARTTLVLLSLGGALWALAGLVDVLASAVRWSRDGGELTRTEVVLSCLGAVALLTAPAASWLRYLRRQVWPSTPRAVAAATRLRSALLASFVAYALCMLAGHVFAALVQPRLGLEGWLAWPVLAFVVSVPSAFAAWVRSSSQ